VNFTAIPVGTARSQAVREARPEQADRSDYRRRKRKQGLQSANAPRRADSTRSSGHCQAHQSGRIGLAFNAAHRRDQPVSVNKRSAVGSQLSHLAVEFGVAHWSARRAAAVPDMLALLRPVGEVQAFDAGTGERADGLTTTAESLFVVQRKRVVELAAQHKLPAMYAVKLVVHAGGLMAYDSYTSNLVTRAPPRGTASGSRSGLVRIRVRPARARRSIWYAH